jgi:hypothetical protein
MQARPHWDHDPADPDRQGNTSVSQFRRRAAVFLAPAMQGLLGHAWPPDDLRDGIALSLCDLCFTPPEDDECLGGWLPPWSSAPIN